MDLPGSSRPSLTYTPDEPVVTGRHPPDLGLSADCRGMVRSRGTEPRTVKELADEKERQPLTGPSLASPRVRTGAVASKIEVAIAHFGLVETAAAFAAKQRGQFICYS